MMRPWWRPGSAPFEAKQPDVLEALYDALGQLLGKVAA